MKKLLKVAVFLSLSLSTLAAVNLTSGDLSYSNDCFLTKKGEQAKGEYELLTQDGRSFFSFHEGKLVEFEYDGKGEEELDIEGQFVENNKYFQGEISVEKKERLRTGKKEKSELSLEGKVNGEKVFNFVKELLSKDKVVEPSFSDVNTWKMYEGRKEIEIKNTTRISKNEENGNYSSYQVEKSEKREIYSKGKLISNSSSSSSSIESKEEKFKKNN